MQMVPLCEHLRAAHDLPNAVVERLRRDAADMMTRGPFSVVDPARTLPAGADSHDYVSQGPYWWPDPDKPDGLPYIRRDGRVNPEVARFRESDHINALTRSVLVLAQAGRLPEGEAWRQRAALLLRTWFLDPVTRMTPHLQFGQGIPGICSGRGIGIIETATLPALCDAAAMLGEAWRPDDRQGLRAWCAAYLDWLLDSPYGREEAGERNNHGTWYDVQVAGLALACDRIDLARDTVAAAAERRVLTQVEADGRQPHELARTRSWEYSGFNLAALLALCVLGRRAGFDLADPATEAGRRVRAAARFLLPYARGEEAWIWPQMLRQRAIHSLDWLPAAAAVLADHDCTATADALLEEDHAGRQLCWG